MSSLQLVLLICMGVFVLGFGAYVIHESLSNPPAPSPADVAIAEAARRAAAAPGDVEPAPSTIEPSPLLPLGWGLIAIGALVALWAWFVMDITPVEYSDTVNIDAISQRSMLHTAGLITALTGAIMACAGHVVNEVRRGR